MDKLKRIDDGEYEYKGQTIYRKNSIPHGQYGRWAVGIRYMAPKFGTLAQAKHHIDREATEKESKDRHEIKRDWEVKLDLEMRIRVGLRLHQFVAVSGKKAVDELYAKFMSVSDAVSSINFDAPEYDYLFNE